MIPCFKMFMDSSSCSHNFPEILQNNYFDEYVSSPPIYESSFKLPMQYLDKKHIHDLSPTVLQDLELLRTQTCNSVPMYDIVFNPQHDFARKMIVKTSSQFTSHIPFLKDTQDVIQNHEKHIKKMENNDYKFNDEKIAAFWSSIKEDSNFLERYSYMEFNFLKQFNYSTSFLQIISFINFVSPIATFLIPFIFFLMPFLMMKIQGIPISFAKYIEVLKEIAKHHVIGKTIKSMENISINGIAYIFITIGFYFLQIYQNFIALSRFYKNICKINENLFEIKRYISYSIHSMETFIEINGDRCYYYHFCQDVLKQKDVLQKIQKELSDIHSGEYSFLKSGDLGYMLRCYYILYDVNEYEESLRFSFSFEGYINNLNGLYENLNNRNIAAATFNDKEKCSIKKQYYPPFVHGDFITNDCSLDKNMVITGVNASGKTTYLKTTTLNIIFTQQFGLGFYESCILNPYTHIHSYLNIPDTSERDSLFQAESRRCKEIIDIIGNNKKDVENRHFCIFDELYSGTNPEEASKTAYAFLNYLCGFPNVDFILTTHYTSICKKIKHNNDVDVFENPETLVLKTESPLSVGVVKPLSVGVVKPLTKMCNYKMNVEKSEKGDFIYTYKIKRGICKIKGAYEVLKNMDYPEEILSKLK